MLSIRLPKDLDERLSRLAEFTKRTKSHFVKEALERYLEDLEDSYEALDRIMKPDAKYYTTEEVKRELDL